MLSRTRAIEVLGIGSVGVLVLEAVRRMVVLEIVRRVVRVLVRIRTIHIRRIHRGFRVLLVKAEIAIVPGIRKIGARVHIHS